jgi:hypothetical protein
MHKAQDLGLQISKEFFDNLSKASPPTAKAPEKVAEPNEAEVKQAKENKDDDLVLYRP